MKKNPSSPIDNRRAKVTGEHREEAARLRVIWEAKKPKLAESGLGNQLAFGAKYGIGTQGAVGFFLNGKTPLSLKAAMGFATGLGCKVSDFSPRLAGELARMGPLLESEQIELAESHEGTDERGPYSVRGDGRKEHANEAPPLPAVIATRHQEVALGQVVRLFGDAVKDLSTARRKTISILVATQIAEAPSTDTLDAIDALTTGASVRLPSLDDDERIELSRLRKWHNSIFSMAEQEPAPMRAVITKFLAGVQTAMSESERPVQSTPSKGRGAPNLMPSR